METSITKQVAQLDEQSKAYIEAIKAKQGEEAELIKYLKEYKTKFGEFDRVLKDTKQGCKRIDKEVKTLSKMQIQLEKQQEMYGQKLGCPNVEEIDIEKAVQM